MSQPNIPYHNFASQDPMARLLGLAGNGASVESILAEAVTIIEEQTRPLRTRLRFLYQVPRALSGIAEPEALLQAGVRTAVAGFADACSVHLIEEHDAARSILRARVVAVDRRLPQEELIVHALRKYQPDPFASRGPGFAVRTGHADLISEVSDEQLQALANDSTHYELLKRAGPKSYMCVPLRLGDPTGITELAPGAMSFVSFRPEMRYDHDDLDAAAWLASLCAGCAPFTALPGQPNGAFSSDSTTVAPHITPTEAEVLKLLSQGHDRKTLPKRLNFSKYTYDSHTSRIRAKLHANNNLEAVIAARAAGLLED